MMMYPLIHLPPIQTTKIVTATNFVVFNKSFQAASLGDASLIAIVATIQVLLHALEELLRRN